MMVRPFSMLLRLTALAALLAGCAPGAATSQTTATISIRAASASVDSHSEDAAPDYEIVFPQDHVNRIDITLSPAAWTALQTEMEEQFGEQGNGGPGGERGFGGQPGGNPGGQPGGNPGEPPGGNGNGPAMDFGDTSYVSGTVTFNGETWNSVGFRYSGNSTLQTSWRSGTKKISFRLDFDEFEDVDPSTKNQRFYGFEQLSFKSNAMDSSYLREKVAGDVFRAAGVIAPQTAFYAVYVDFGEGAQYFGLYTAVEIVDDSLIKTAFADGSGNVYKPEGSGAAFVEGTFNAESFEKQTNAEEANWSDIERLFTALHSDLRTSDPAAWRAQLQQVFDVDGFLRWLAIDTIMQNWDTYGAMAHNYYLYNDPSTGKLTWIPWDNNMALSAAMQEGPGELGGRGGGRAARALDLASVTSQWPLIRYLIDDPTYLAQYRQNLQQAIASTFTPETLTAAYQRYHDLIAPYVAQETADATQLESIERFDAAEQELIQHAQQRYQAVLEYLGE